jgi:hypothetical protein
MIPRSMKLLQGPRMRGCLPNLLGKFPCGLGEVHLVMQITCTVVRSQPVIALSYTIVRTESVLYNASRVHDAVAMNNFE